jgi:hypothetical protein
MPKAESTPLERWLCEGPRDESWNPLGLLQRFYELTEQPEVAAEDNIKSLSSCSATYAASVDWEHEVFREENGPTLELSAENMSELCGVPSGTEEFPPNGN